MREKTLTVHAPPARLYSAKRAFSFPFVEARALTGDAARLAADGVFASRLTLLGCSGSRMAQPMVDGWLDGVLSAASAAGPALQTVRLSLVEGGALTWFERPLLWTMRATVPREQHASFFAHFGNAEPVRRQLRMENRYLGYVCLVDRAGTVRWHVHSNEPPSEEQVQGLAALVLEQQGVAPPPRRAGAHAAGGAAAGE
jgi:ATPase complex subunit ATP10